MNRSALLLLLLGATCAVAGASAYDWRLGAVLAGVLLIVGGIALIDVDAAPDDQEQPR